MIRSLSFLHVILLVQKCFGFWYTPATTTRRVVIGKPLHWVRQEEQPEAPVINSTNIPPASEIAARFGIRPYTPLPAWVWKIAWRGQGRLLPLLHGNDPAHPKDSDQSLKVLWNKAVVSIDPSSPGYDKEWTYDLLPSPSRMILRLLRPLLPRLHHANIELRTTYLNSIIQQEIDAHVDNNNNNNNAIRLVSLGGGYDARCTRLLTDDSLVQQAWELDLADVVASKEKMLYRLAQQRRDENVRQPFLSSIDLNNHTAIAQLLQHKILTTFTTSTTTTSIDWHTIFVSEGLLIYLDDPNGLLRICATAVAAANGTASLCFADRLAHVPGGDERAGRQALAEAGWDLVEWQPKPGLARHMGLARLRKDSNTTKAVQEKTP